MAKLLARRFAKIAINSIKSQIELSSSGHEVLKALKSPEVTREEIVLGMRHLARNVRSQESERSLLADSEYKDLKQFVESNLDKLGPQEIVNLSFWVGSLSTQNSSELTKEGELKLLNRIKDISNDQVFTFEQILELFRNLRTWGRYSYELEKIVFNFLDQNQESISMKQVVDLLKNSMESMKSPKINFVSRLVQCIDSKGIENLNTKQSIEVFNLLSKIDEEEINRVSIVLKKIVNALTHKVNEMSEQEMLEILDLHIKMTNIARTLLVGVFNRMTKDLETRPQDYSNFFVLKSVIKIAGLIKTGEYTVPKDLKNVILNETKERIDENFVPSSDFADVILDLIVIEKALPKDLVLSLVKKTQELKRPGIWTFATIRAFELLEIPTDHLLLRVNSI